MRSTIAEMGSSEQSCPKWNWSHCRDSEEGNTIAASRRKLKKSSIVIVTHKLRSKLPSCGPKLLFKATAGSYLLSVMETV